MRKHWFLSLLIACFWLSACTTQPPQAPSSESVAMSAADEAMDASMAIEDKEAFSSPMADTRLGTQWGESYRSQTVSVSATRENSQPDDIYSIHYSAAGERGEALTNVLLADGRIRFSVINGNDQPYSFVRNRTGDHIYGREGERYQLHYQNLSQSQAYEIVASVDGVDVISGQPASVTRRGYLLDPGDTLTIEGFRESSNSVAAFRFSRPESSYAANSAKNTVANVGVIASAVYKVRVQQTTPRTIRVPDPYPANPFPADPPGQYAEPPRYDR